MRFSILSLGLLIVLITTSCSRNRETIHQPELVPIYSNSQVISTNDNRLSTGKLERIVVLQTTDTQDQVFKWYQSRLSTTNLEEDVYGTSSSNLYFQDKACPHYYLTLEYDAGKITLKFGSYDCI